MSKIIIFFFYLISISLCGYLPLKKHNGFDDNVCGYLYGNINYVKTCKDKGKYCKYIGDSTSICEDIPTAIALKTLDESCNSRFECEKGLFCYSGKCLKSSNSAINCGTNSEAHRTENGWVCKTSTIAEYCYYRDNSAYSFGFSMSPDYSKVCGEINFETSSLGSNLGTKYEILTIKSAYIGTVPDGKFVQDVKACKSGYALPFYPDSTLIDPSLDTSNANKMYLKCVNINDIDYKGYHNCIFKYDSDKLYDASKVDYDLIEPRSISISGRDFINNNYNDEFCYENLMTKLEMFSKYIGVFTEAKQKECEKKENYNEPETCNDNEIRKWFYYYNNPEHYNLYYDEKGNDVANYRV